MAFTITNILSNPSAEVDFAHINLAGGGVVTPTRVTSWAKSGTRSVQLVCNGAAGNQGINYASIDPWSSTYLGVATPFVGSVWLDAGSGNLYVYVEVRYLDATNAFSNLASVALTGAEQRVVVTGTTNAAKSVRDFRLFVVTNGAQAITYRVDAAMVHTGASAVTYFDGSTANGTWTGTVHDSASVWTNTLPVVSAGADAETDVDGVFEQAGSFTDDTGSSWTATVNYGDGGGTGALTLAGTNFTLSHTYDDPGEYTVTVTVTDNYADAGVDTMVVTVPAPPPTDDANEIRNQKIAAAIAAGAV